MASARHMQHNKKTSPDHPARFEIRQDRRLPPQYRVENTHEAIISEEDFFRVREMIDIRRRQQKEGTTQIFSGLIKCADCGWSLGYGRRRKKDSYDGYYHCSKNGQGLRQCSMHYIRFDNLYAYVLSRLQYWSMQAQRNEDDLLRQLMGASDKERAAARKNSLPNSATLKSTSRKWTPCPQDDHT